MTFIIRTMLVSQPTIVLYIFQRSTTLAVIVNIFICFEKLADVKF